MSLDGATELVLDGMPTPPPRWERPDRAVRMSALHLDHMLAAALPHCGVDEDLPALMAVHLLVSTGTLRVTATDRYTAIRERRSVNQECDGFAFLLSYGDARCLRVLLAKLLKGLKDEAREWEPVDIVHDLTPDGPQLGVLGDDLDVRFTLHPHLTDFPDISTLVDTITDRLDKGHEPANQLLNPTLLARAVALQNAGRKTASFRYQAPKTKGTAPLVISTTDDDDDAVIVVMAMVDRGSDA
jgi:hypothetical protein